MIPMHAVATSNPQQLRWVVAPDSLPAGGVVRQAPGRLGVLLDRGVIHQLTVHASDVLITLGDPYSWRDRGDEIREALGDALLDPAGWRVDPPADGDALLTEITTELLAGPIGALAESHGGSIELVSVTGHDVVVRMSGACHGCPAAASTLQDQLQRELRRRVSSEVTVRSENRSAPMTLGKKLLRLTVR